MEPLIRESRRSGRNVTETNVSKPNIYSGTALKVAYVAMVQCLRCRMRTPIEVDREELTNLRSFKRIRRSCAQCDQETEWQYLPLGVSR